MPAVTVAGALALAGCGGESSTTTTTQRVVPPVVPPVPPSSTETPFEKAGGTTGALLDPEGDLYVAPLNNTAGFEEAKKDGDLISGLYGSKNPGKKWHEILGATDMSLGGGTGKAVKVTGKRSDWGITSTPVTTQNTPITTDVSHKGFTGALICTGADCNSPATASAEFAGSWYFYVTDDTSTVSVNEAAADWVKDKDDDKKYVLRTAQAYADWGVWLADVTGRPGRIIHRYRRGGPNPGGTWSGDKAPMGASNEATYTGGAVGVSTLYETKEDAGDEKVGSFTATAELTATFGSSPTLEGKITDFKGDAVNTNWELELQSSTLTDTGGLAASDNADDNVTNRQTTANRAVSFDSWNAQFYGTGTDNDRPVGVVGDFDGRFRDGQAVGVFHAE